MKTLFFIAIILIPCCSICQNKDYIVKTNGDTLWGNIKLKNKIFYVSGADVTEVSGNDVRKIKSGNYKGNTVVPCKLVTYTDDLESLHLYYAKDESVDTIMILDEIMTTPKINLYYGVSNFRTPYYFYKTPADSLPVQLIIRFLLQGGFSNDYKESMTYGVNNPANINLYQDKAYANQLYGIMGDCKKIPEGMWSVLAYREYSFKQLIKRYNKCK